MVRAREALAEADVALLVVDGTAGVTHQEQRLAEEIAAAATGLVILLNKWDITDTEQKAITEDGVGDRLAFVGWAPVLRVAARTGAIVTAEEHTVIGGLGGAVTEALCDGRPVPVERVGIYDSFMRTGTGPEPLLDACGLAIADVVAAAERVLRRK